ncbi:MAG: nucleotidyltransferase domain-containing protein [Rhizomicrobium sp.]|nr:nucleotidyltransferase domain-containing protein [Rhizomicrobium sp.]
MDKPLPDDPILARLKRELAALYGTRLKQVLLYGSRARGDHRDDSDYDVLVVLEGPVDWWAEQKQLSALSDQILWDTVGTAQPVVTSFKPVCPEDIHKRTGFMFNVRREAIAL